MLTFGYLGDAIGRPKAMLLTMLLVTIAAVGSGLAFLGESIQVMWIGIFRFILGLGIGGIYPLSAAASYECKDMGSDSSDSSARAAWALFWQQPGQLFTYAIAFLLLGIFGTSDYNLQYRLMLISGIFPSIFVLPTLLVNARLEEGKIAEKKPDVGASLNQVLQSPESVRALLGTTLAWFLFDIYAYGITLYSPEILEDIFGSTETLSGIYWENALSILITIPFAGLSVWALGKLGSRRLQLEGFGIAVVVFLVVAVAFSATSNKVVLFMLFLVLKAAAIFAVPTTTFVLPNELFDVQIRSTCNGISAAAGKFGAFVGTFVFPYIYDGLGMAALFYVCAGVALVGLLVTLAFIPSSPTPQASTPQEPETVSETSKLLPNEC